jgi:hypothetical protein
MAMGAGAGRQIAVASKLLSSPKSLLAPLAPRVAAGRVASENAAALVRYSE